jgi:hypothetical protein
MIMRMAMDHVSIRTASSASSTCGGPCRHRNSRRPLQSHSPRHRNHRAVTPRRFRACTTDSHHDLPVAPNRLSQNFAASRPDQIWLADITYVPLYLAAVLDLFTRKIVGWEMQDHLPTLDYVKKRKADGNGKMEIIRCLKRFIAREIFGYLCGARQSLTSLPKTT